MELAQRQRHEFSHNSLHVSGGHAQVQYGHTYNSKLCRNDVVMKLMSTVTQTPEPAWTDVCKWIFGPEPVFWQRAFQTSMQSRRIENDTGRWFLEGSSFEQWLSQPNTFLWLHGKSKHLPSAHVLEHGSGRAY